MAQDLNNLLQAFTELTQSSKEGKLTPAQLETEIRRLTGELQAALSNLTTQLRGGDSPEGAYMMELFQAQVRNIIEQSGMKPQQLVEDEAETKKLSEEVESLKRGPVRT
jgi:hypothetical protein